MWEVKDGRSPEIAGKKDVAEEACVVKELNAKGVTLKNIEAIQTRVTKIKQGIVKA